MALQVSEAEATVLILQRKRARLVAHGRELSDERVSVVIQAQTYEPGARARLREINSELALLDNELRNLDASIRATQNLLRLAEAGWFDLEKMS
jgi:hypothetical protein